MKYGRLEGCNTNAKCRTISCCLRAGCFMKNVLLYQCLSLQLRRSRQKSCQARIQAPAYDMVHIGCWPKKVQERRDFNLALLNTLNESIRERTSRRVIDQKHNVVLPFGDIIFYNEYQDKNKIHVRGHCLPNSKRQIQIFEDTFLKRLRRIYRNNNSHENNPYKCFMK